MTQYGPLQAEEWLAAEGKRRRSKAKPVERGGQGSGHFGHEGRHGEVGGSAPGSGPTTGTTTKTGRDFGRVVDHVRGRASSEGKALSRSDAQTAAAKELLEGFTDRKGNIDLIEAKEWVSAFEDRKGEIGYTAWGVGFTANAMNDAISVWQEQSPKISQFAEPGGRWSKDLDTEGDMIVAYGYKPSPFGQGNSPVMREVKIREMQRGEARWKATFQHGGEIGRRFLDRRARFSTLDDAMAAGEAWLEGWDRRQALAQRNIAFVHRGYSRSKCMDCSKPPVADFHWANGHGRAWLCKEHADAFLGGDGDDDVQRAWFLPTGEAPLKMGEGDAVQLRKLGEGIGTGILKRRLAEALTAQASPVERAVPHQVQTASYAGPVADTLGGGEMAEQTQQEALRAVTSIVTHIDNMVEKVQGRMKAEQEIDRRVADDRIAAAIGTIERSIAAVLTESNARQMKVTQSEAGLLDRVLDVIEKSAKGQDTALAALAGTMQEFSERVAQEVGRGEPGLAEAIQAMLALAHRPPEPLNVTFTMPDETTVTEVVERDSLGRLLRSVTTRLRNDEPPPT